MHCSNGIGEGSPTISPRIAPSDPVGRCQIDLVGFIALTNAGSHDEAMAAATGLIDAAEATRNPYAISFALLACRDANPDRAREGRAACPC
jgi:hypothetical protein